MGYGLDGWGLIPGRGRIFLFRMQTNSGAHPISYPMGTGGCFPGSKEEGHEADHSSPSSTNCRKLKCMMAGVDCSGKAFIPSVTKNYLAVSKVERDTCAHAHTIF
jgi:hypothetical protein